MKYLVIGTGGTGGMIASALKLANFDVSVIARGKHLEQIKQNGLKIVSDVFGEHIINFPAYSVDEYKDRPDVIFICTKYYSISEIIPFIQKIVDKQTIIIPVLNVFGLGDELQEKIPKAIVLDGCIYIISYISDYGVISHPSKMFKICFGKRNGQVVDKKRLENIEKDLRQAGIEVVLSDNILKDTFSKVTLISPYAACGIYYDVPIGKMQKRGEERDFLIKLLEELQQLANKMNLNLDFDVVERNLEIIDKMHPDTISSLHRDLKNNKKAELDGQIFKIVELGQKYGLNMSNYRLVAVKFGYNE